jgi:DNA gyrase subunit A
MYFLPVLDVPEGSRASRGQSLYALAQAGRQDPIVSVVPVDDLNLDRSVVFLSRKGLMKRTSLSDFSNPRAGGIIAAGVKSGDEIFRVGLSNGDAEVLVFSKGGRAIRFPETQISILGRTAQGVKGMGLKGDDRVVGMLLVRREAQVLTITEDGFGRRTMVDEFPLQNRGGLGTLVFGGSGEESSLVSALEVVEGEDVMVVSAGGKVFRLPVDDIPEQHRRSRGKRLVSLPAGDRVVEVTRASGKGGKEPNADRVGGGGSESGSEAVDQMELLS